MDWMTKALAAEYDYISPSGASEIRLLPSFEQGELAHATALPDKPSNAATLTGIGELFYILSGNGELWRATGSLQHVVPLNPGRCVSLPPGIDYQYRAITAAMTFVVLTVPRWERELIREAGRRYWNKDGAVIATAANRPGPWVTTDLPENYHYLAPDGSEIRLLASFDAGGLAHCRLPAGKISGPVRHRTVKEIWYVVSGHGEVWRADGVHEEIVTIEPAMCLTIPTGASFQFRTVGDDALEMVIATLPAWPGASEAVPVRGCWTMTAA
jgi:mannose-6-phosphate isomerase-like protein (cupin superfamily)